MKHNHAHKQQDAHSGAGASLGARAKVLSGLAPHRVTGRAVFSRELNNEMTSQRVSDQALGADLGVSDTMVHMLADEHRTEALACGDVYAIAQHRPEFARAIVLRMLDRVEGMMPRVSCPDRAIHVLARDKGELASKWLEIRPTQKDAPRARWIEMARKAAGVVRGALGLQRFAEAKAEEGRK